MDILIAFLVATFVGVVVYLVAGLVPFLAAYQSLLAILAFALAAFLYYRNRR